MSSTEQIANAFAVDFFEALVRNPEEICGKFSPMTTLLINDFSMGVVASENQMAAKNFKEWATSLASSKLVVDYVCGSSVYGGVQVYINFHAVGQLEEFFQMNATLEAVDSYDDVPAFFIRHLILSRVGAVEVEVPPPQPVEPVKPAKEKSIPPTPKKTPAAEERPIPTKETPRRAEPAAAAAAAAAAAPKVPEQPSSWKARVASPVTATDETKCVRVVVSAAAPAAAKPSAPKDGAAARPRKDSPKEYPKRERKPAEAIGDRLMFNAEGVAQDSDIRAALGPLGVHLVSLRNNSRNNGLVFMDFVAGVKVLDELRKTPMIVCEKKVSVFRQRPREGETHKEA
eukprot:gene6053-4353_t